ncbi:response regulator [Cohnella panacarvi]|uniref:response regulator n=1 Tax=Cohnella panacarvi TaxID=400776 RepID=UPI00047C1F17|nr:response regulator [Cohnella panacarvi]
MKLLIVDDEQIERDGLEAILRSGFPDADIRQAKNGMKAIEAVPEFKPDLILMDIKMPGISGLEAVERIREDYPDMRFIIVTAYEMFDYARKALKLGVEDFLLKPSRASEIIESVGNVIHRIVAERSEKDALLSVLEADVVTQLLFDRVHEVHLDEMLGMLGGDTTREAFVMLLTLSRAQPAEHIYGAVKEKLRTLGSGWIGAMSGRQIPLIVFREAGKSYRAQASSLAQQLLSLQQRGSDCFIGIGNPYGTLDQIRFSYQEALIASADMSQPVKFRFYSELPSWNDRRNDYQEQQLERQFLDRIRLGRWPEVRHSLMSLIQRGEDAGLSLVEAQQRALNALWLISRVLLEMGVEADNPLFAYQCPDYPQLRTETDRLLDHLMNAIAARQDRMEPDVVQRIKQYIVAHSSEEISLETIARQVDLNPFYISKMFKEQLGINYIDFLTECRIDKAKSLMGNPERSLKEITFEVGYNDPNYFSKVFKKSCGMSPTEYRKALLGSKG